MFEKKAEEYEELLKNDVEKEESTIESDGEIKEYTPVEISVDVIKEMIKIGTWKGSLEEEEIMYNLENNLYPEDYTKELNKLLKSADYTE